MASAFGFRSASKAAKAAADVVGPVTEMAVEGAHGLHGQVHALPVEGHNGVSCVTDEHRPVVHRPATASHRGKPAGGVLEELLDEVGNHGHQVGEFPLEEQGHRIGVRQRSEASVPLVRREKGGGEVTFGVGECDQHELPPWPNVERMGIEAEPTAVGRWNL